jgi:predicted alpha-1,2-mannosidase
MRLPCKNTLQNGGFRKIPYLCGNTSCQYEKYKAQASRWENLWNPQMESLGFHGFAWPRNSDGTWYEGGEDYDVFSSGSFEHQFYETFSWELSFYVPHDMKRLIEKIGGKEAFIERMDTYFNTPFAGKRNELLHWTKLYGMCQISNEPCFLTPSAYCWVNQPYKTAKIVRSLMSTMYDDTRKGVPGNDDSGSMGAWYAFHALGFFPNAGQDVYLISSPVFTRSVIIMENGEKLTIEARDASPENIYIQSCRLNGKPLDRCWLRHGEIAGNATLEFVMGPEPSRWAENGQLPPSMSDI